MSTPKPNALPRLILTADTAEELMAPNPVSIEASATVSEAIELMTDRGYSAAPVIDERGRPVGVLTRTDLLVYRREQSHRAQLVDRTEWDVPPPSGRESAEGAATLVRDVMTPVIFTVRPLSPARQVVEQMLSLKVHHLFVVDEGSILVGVISSLDVLRHLGDG